MNINKIFSKKLSCLLFNLAIFASTFAAANAPEAPVEYSDSPLKRGITLNEGMVCFRGKIYPIDTRCFVQLTEEAGVEKLCITPVVEFVSNEFKSSVRKLLSLDKNDSEYANAHRIVGDALAAECYNDYEIRNGRRKVNIGKFRFLVENCIDHTSGASFDLTQFMLFAINTTNPEIVELFLKNGVAVNADLAAGLTPMHFAALNGYIPIAQLLFKYAAQPGITSKDILNGEKVPCVIDFAVAGGYTAMIEWLLDNGCIPTRHAIDMLKGKISNVRKYKLDTCEEVEKNKAYIFELETCLARMISMDNVKDLD